MHIRNAVRCVLTFFPVVSLAILASAQTAIHSWEPKPDSSKGYVAELVSTAAYGAAMNNAADVAARPFPIQAVAGRVCLPLKRFSGSQALESSSRCFLFT